MKAGIVYSSELVQLACTSPKFADRYALVIGLIHSYGLFRHLLQIPPLNLSSKAEVYKTLTIFHSTDYIDALYQLQEWYANDPDPRLSADEEDFLDTYGLSYDCPGFRCVLDYALAAVRGSLAAAMALTRGDCRVVLNFAGGWHHAKRSEAAGFCYLNDIVLAIHHFLACSTDPSCRNRVLYVDFDLHHADGVEQAFWYSAHVVTFSVHHAAPGFFPGTGTNFESNTVVDDEGISLFAHGAGRGQFAAFNLPLAEGGDDQTWSDAVLPLLDMLYSLTEPNFVVVQCGADCLATDPHGIFNLTNLAYRDSPTPNPEAEIATDGNTGHVTSGYLQALERILAWQIPTLILGGGGYNYPDTARLWTRLAAFVVEQVNNIRLNLPSEIPDHCFLDRYGPDFELDVSSMPRTNRTSSQDIRSHHTRLFKQACSYADLNGLNFDRAKYREKLCGVS